MQEGRASRTADRVAERRAAHQLLDSPRVFDDPLALRIIAPEAAARLREQPSTLESTPFARILRAFLAVRSRFAEDRLAEAVSRGVRQYVIVGAGFDTFAYRNPWPELRVFEVDHPATQREKRARLEAAGIDVPPSVTFAAADLAVTPLSAALRDAGFDDSQPAFFAWLGVVMYLDREAIDGTLRTIAALPGGSSVAFDYAVPPSSLGFTARMAVRMLANRVAKAGEPFKTYFDPAELRDHLHALGFTGVEDVAPADIKRVYGVETGTAAHLVIATNT